MYQDIQASNRTVGLLHCRLSLDWRRLSLHPVRRIQPQEAARHLGVSAPQPIVQSRLHAPPTALGRSGGEAQRLPPPVRHLAAKFERPASLLARHRYEPAPGAERVPACTAAAPPNCSRRCSSIIRRRRRGSAAAGRPSSRSFSWRNSRRPLPLGEVISVRASPSGR
jgi:hypothetical protein